MSRRYVATSNMFGGGIDPNRTNVAELEAFLLVVKKTFGADPFKIFVDYDTNYLCDRLIATEAEEEE